MWSLAFSPGASAQSNSIEEISALFAGLDEASLKQLQTHAEPVFSAAGGKLAALKKKYPQLWAAWKASLGQPESCLVVNPKDPTTTDFKTKNLSALLGEFRKHDAAAGKLTGSAKLGFTSEGTASEPSQDSGPFIVTASTDAGNAVGIVVPATPQPELFKLNFDVALGRGTYPARFEFKAKADVQFAADEVRENLSDFDLSYRYHFLQSPRRLDMNTTFYGRRFTNKFMNIDERYEAGVLFDLGTLTLLTGSGRRDVEELDKLIRAVLNPASTGKAGWFDRYMSKDGVPVGNTRAVPWTTSEPDWIGCFESVSKARADKFKKELEEIWRDLAVMAIRTYRAKRMEKATFTVSWFRVGAFAEFERATLVRPEYAISTDGTLGLDPVSQATFEASDKKFRWVWAPSLKLRMSSHWTLDAGYRYMRAFDGSPFKLNGVQIRHGLNGTDEPLVLNDAREEASLVLTFKAGDNEFGQPGAVEASLGWTRYVDRAPPFAREQISTLGTPLAADSDPTQLFNVVVAQRSYDRIVFNIGVSWK